MSKRIPGMYHFYFNSITQAIHEENWEEFDRILADTPDDIREALVRNEVIEESVEASRDSSLLEEHLRLAIVVLNEQGYLADRAWPSSYEFEELLTAAKEDYNA